MATLEDVQAHGMNKTELANETGVHIRTVQRWFCENRVPRWLDTWLVGYAAESERARIMERRRKAYEDRLRLADEIDAARGGS